MRQIIVTGSRKMLVYDEHRRREGGALRQKPRAAALFRHGTANFACLTATIGKTVAPIQWVEPLRQECQHFVDCIRTGCPPRSGGAAGLRVVKTLESAQKSLFNEGLWVPVGL